MNLIKTRLGDTDKVFESLIARSSNLFQGSLKQKTFYLHIPKCGGISIRKAIKSCYLSLDILQDRYLTDLPSTAAFNAAQISANQTGYASDTTNDYEVLKFRENLLLYYMCQSQIKFISGHFTFSATAYQYFSDKFAFITVLRNPVERWISAYFYNRYKKQGHRKIDADITTYLKSEFGRSQGYEYVKFLGGINKEGDYTSKQAINRAKENLRKFSVVGCLEHKECFVDQFEERFGRKLNIGVAKPRNQQHIKPRSEITEEIREEIKEICSPDLDVYQYVITNFVKP